MTAKPLKLFRQMLPTRRTIAVLSNPTDPNNEVSVREVQGAADATGQPIYIVNASGERDFDAAFAKIIEHRAAALFVIADPQFTSRRAGGRLDELRSRPS